MMPKKYLSLVLILLLVASSLSGCIDPKYRGENSELYTVAIYNFFGSAGHGSNGEISIQSEIGIIETDSYGRVLFYYHEGIMDEGCGYGILQKTEDGCAYYYEDDCVICATDDWRGNGKVSHDEWFSEEELSAFKVRNDWEQPMNEDKCTKKPIVSQKPKAKLTLKDKNFDQAAKTYLTERGFRCSEKSVYQSSEFFLSDNYGRELYYVRCNEYNVYSPYENIVLAIIFNPDGSCDHSKGVIQIEDMQNYREVLKAFKESNGWNTEYKTK